MQQNDLEQFIQQNREAFDDAYPSLKLWSDIENKLDGDQSTKVQPLRVRRPWYQIAAAAAVLLLVGGVGGMYLTQATQSPPTAQEILEQFAPEFRETEQYYQAQIQERYAQLTAYTEDQDVKADLDQIDVAMQELRTELADAPPGREEQVVQELMDSYRLKLQILEHVIETIQQQDIQTTSPQDYNNETSI